MTFSVHGLAVARGIAIGRAVLVASSRVDVAHYFVQPEQVEGEIERVRNGRNAVVEELQRLQTDMPADAPHELTALLDVHLMLLQDEALTGGVKHWITERLYNAEWALTTQLEREAARLAALLESGRAQSRGTGVPVRWLHTGRGAGGTGHRGHRPHGGPAGHHRTDAQCAAPIRQRAGPAVCRERTREGAPVAPDARGGRQHPALRAVGAPL